MGGGPVGLSRWNWKGLTLGELVDSMAFERGRKSEWEWEEGYE